MRVLLGIEAAFAGMKRQDGLHELLQTMQSDLMHRVQVSLQDDIANDYIIY